MSEPNLKRHRWLAVDKPNCAANPTVNNRHAADAEYQRQHLERICELEKALEQSLASSNELRQKLKDQHLLETQLAATEEIANLQQQVINELKHQLAQQQSVNVQYIQARISLVCQESAREHERALARLQQLKQQIVTLQEQLLQQSQQVGEYEATIQYWKERYLDLQIALQQKTLEQVVLTCTDAPVELLKSVQAQTSITATLVASKLPSPPLTRQLTQVDLPAFLTQHRKDKQAKVEHRSLDTK